MYNDIINKLKSELITCDKDVKKKIDKAIVRLKKREDVSQVLSDLGVYDIDTLNSIDLSVKKILPDDIPIKDVIPKKVKSKREFTVIKVDQKNKEEIS